MKKFYLQLRRYYIKYWKRDIKFCWNQLRLLVTFRPKELWHRLWIRKDGFHSSLSLDGQAMLLMTDEQLERYRMRLVRVRQIAHDRDLERMRKKYDKVAQGDQNGNNNGD